MISESEQRIFYVGSESEVAHHAAALQSQLPIIIAEPDEVLAQAVPGDLAIFFSEHFDRFRETCRLLLDRQCATLYAIDGILEWRNAWENQPDEPACPWTMRPVQSHKVACIGPGQKRVLDTWGNAAKTELVGLPRLDRLAECRRNDATSDKFDDRPFRVLVMTAKWPGFTDEQVANAKRGLSDLKSWFAENPKCNGRTIEPIWRLTHGLDQQLAVSNTLSDLSGKELHELLSGYGALDGVIDGATDGVMVDAMITTPSTTMLEGMLAGVPVALLEYNPCPIYVPAAWHIHCARQIDAVMQDIVEPPHRKLFLQNALLADHLSNGKGSQSTKRMCELISRMLEITRQKISDKQPLEFPPNLLGESNATTHNHFLHHDVYPDEADFRNFDITQLQVELAHARREIEHRQQLLDQANKELGQAHEILFSIEQHPIAGPIIRARKKFLDWMSSRKASS